jgi:hypothetical protein
MHVPSLFWNLGEPSFSSKDSLSLWFLRTHFFVNIHLLAALSEECEHTQTHADKVATTTQPALSDN